MNNTQRTEPPARRPPPRAPRFLLSRLLLSSSFVLLASAAIYLFLSPPASLSASAAATFRGHATAFADAFATVTAEKRCDARKTRTSGAGNGGPGEVRAWAVGELESVDADELVLQRLPESEGFEGFAMGNHDGATSITGGMMFSLAGQKLDFSSPFERDAPSLAKHKSAGADGTYDEDYVRESYRSLVQSYLMPFTWGVSRDSFFEIFKRRYWSGHLVCMPPLAQFLKYYPPPRKTAEHTTRLPKAPVKARIQ